MAPHSAHVADPHLPRQALFHYLFAESDTKQRSPTNVPRPDSIALVDGITGFKLSRQQFRLRCQSVAADLRRRGLKRGDVVGVMGLNSIDWLVAFHASHCAGLRVSPINWA
jgi:acyl-CoA synthetase (AMP-forming)/AMP-acid ligase II